MLVCLGLLVCTEAWCTKALIFCSQQTSFCYLCNIFFLEPRVLDLAQLGDIRVRIGEWKAKSKQALFLVEGQASELFV